MRNQVIDILRALTMVLMVTVNEFWSVDGIPHWMHHAATFEDMMGLSDIVFPLFLIIMGMAIPYAIDSKEEKSGGRAVVAHILSRTVALLVMGAFICNAEYGISAASGYSGAVYNIIMVVGFFLVWNKYPQTQLSRGVVLLRGLGVIALLFLMVTSRNDAGETFSAHWWGILGLIGWTYLICAMFYFLFRDRRRVLVGILVCFVTLNILLTPMNPANTSRELLTVGGADFLRTVLGIFHMNNCGLCALGMGGVVFSIFTRPFVGRTGRRESLALIASSVALFAGFLVTHEFFIISKNIATPPWILAVMSLAVMLYFLLSLIVEKGCGGWFRLIRPAGSATLTCYMLPYVLYGLIGVTAFTFPDVLLHYPIGLAKCFGFAFFCVGLTFVLGKCRVVLKV